MAVDDTSLRPVKIHRRAADARPVLRVIAGRACGEVFVLTRGGPLESTLTLVYHLYERAFYHFEMGYASALAFLLLGFVGVILVLQRRLLGGDPVAEAGR